MSSSSEDEENDSPPPNAALLHLLTGGAGAGADEDSEDEENLSKASAAAPAASISAAPTSTGGSKRVVTEEATAGVYDPLPSASSVLFDSGEPKPIFLRVAGPEFDASTNFKAPPVSHSDLTGINLDPYRPLRGARAPGEEAPAQQYHEEHNFPGGADSGQVRVRGSVCFETDDERGRRVRYGAHSMLRADPWSACNPNKALRSWASGKKRRAGEY